MITSITNSETGTRRREDIDVSVETTQVGQSIVVYSKRQLLNV